ncbi:hypothetical protein RHSIM_Rhsim06G0172000 [Rhododendron simsii]|uniref:Uncharacterized protein n=1 Tax=Rhododendron simsii TaxID=118357 RepID=A0A834GRB3_RHOSS|nr:hypothetical protein RHSIM_Rhsim06G0172000 [Rhododendron simsii]
MKVEILSSKVIKPSIPTPLHLKEHKISFLDQLVSPIHFGMVFFFLPSDSKSSTAVSNTNENSSKTCDQLERSLSATLSRYYPLAGRFFKGGFVVDCNDQGVEFWRAKVNGEIAGIVRGSPEMKLIDALVPDPLGMARSDPWPVLAVQINVFDCGGIAMGIRILHTIGDGVSVLAFLKDWGSGDRAGLKQELVCCPSFELGSLFPARKLVELKPLPPANSPPNRLVTKCFLFDGATISALKSEAVASGSGELAERKPSRVQVVTAHIWRALIQISQAKHGHLRPSLMSFAMSLRGRLIPFQIPENSYGTLVGHTTVRYNPGESNTELNTLVGLLRNAITKTGNDYAKARHSNEIYSMLINYYNEIGGDKPGEVDLCRFTSWCGFSCYGINFGWGRPSWVATVSKGVELVFLLDDISGDGIEAWVTLNEDDMVEFERRHLDNNSTMGICSKL